MDAVFCKTNAGQGFKIVINGKWLYASKANLLKVVRNEAKSCHFGSIEGEEDLDSID